MMRTVSNIFLIVLTLFLFGKSVLAYTSPGTATGFVNDFANVLKPEEKSALETKLQNFKNETSNEIVVITIATLSGDPIDTYANTLFREWGIGGKERNNGILVLAAIEDRKMRVEVGYGLEGAMPDLLTKQIQDADITPSFKNEKYGDGLSKGVDSLIAATKGEYEAPKQTKKSFPFELIFFALFMGSQILISVLAPTKSWWLGGVIGGGAGAIAGLVLKSLLFGGLLAAGGIGLGLLLDWFVSKSYEKSGGRDDFWNRGGFFGGTGSSWGGSGGGFGGFGGGSSGGGGSSSSW